MSESEAREVFSLRTSTVMFVLGTGFCICVGGIGFLVFVLCVTPPSEVKIGDYLVILGMLTGICAFGAVMAYLLAYHAKARMELGDETLFHSGVIFGGKPIEARFDDVERLSRSSSQNGSVYFVHLRDGRKLFFTDRIDACNRLISRFEAKTGMKFE